MTHPNSVTNGASLEDCHTNFFALTDLCGIKWRRLCANNVFCVDHLDDPVLVSYTKCLAADILCVWRRVPTSNVGNVNGLDHGHSHQHHRPSDSHQLNYPKELWIFWYGDEPDLSKVLCSELSDAEQGSWDMGLSYECRTLLFKALHNLIERCLLTYDFARLGKWFVQPYSGPGKASASPHLTFRFSFFVHGESTVCASVDVREHPSVSRLNHQHILQAQSTQNGKRVILSPYGLQGTLTGQTFKDSDGVTSKLLEEWSQFYPVPSSNTVSNGKGINIGGAVSKSSKLPPELETMPSMVEVIVAGVKMRYPSCYVFVTEHNDSFSSTKYSATNTQMTSNANVVIRASSPAVNSKSSLNLNSPTSPCDDRFSYLKPSAADWSFPESVRNDRDFTPKLIHRVCRDNAVSFAVSEDKSSTDNWNSSATNQIDVGGDDSNCTSNSDCLGQWDVHDPIQKASCLCLRCKSKKNVTNATGNKSSSSMSNSTSANNNSKKGDKNEKQHARYTRSSAFHRRSLIVEDNITMLDAEFISRKYVVNSENIQQQQPPVISGNQSGSTNLNCNTDGIPQLRSVTNSGQQPDMLASVSPHSVAPSPLLASSSGQSQQLVAQPASDPTMPTLSPHPPLIQEQENIPPPPPSNQEIAVDDIKPNVVGPKTPASVQTPRSQDPVIKTEQTFSPFTNPSIDQKSSEIMQWAQQTGSTDPDTSQSNTTVQISDVGLKRPVLQAFNYDDGRDEDLSSGLLYDYTLVNAWVHHPVKRFKPEMKNDRFGGSHTYRRKNVNQNGFVENGNVKYDTNSGIPGGNGPTPMNDFDSLRARDPYEFIDGEEHEENSSKIAAAAAVASSAAFRKMEGGKDDEKYKENGPISDHQSVGTPSGNKDDVNGQVDSPSTPRPAVHPSSFTRERDLIVTGLDDLAQLFDTSGDDSDGGNSFQAPTPPGSNKPVTSTSSDEGVTTISRCNRNSSTMNVNLGVAELCRMFPTPPSLEHNPAPSPCTTADCTVLYDVDWNNINNRDKCDTGSLGSPGIDVLDWTYVFKTPEKQMFVQSSKYLPLTNLPSSQLPPITLPSDCIYKPWQQQQQYTSAQIQPNPGRLIDKSHQQPQTQHTQIHHHQHPSVSHHMSNNMLPLDNIDVRISQHQQFQYRIHHGSGSMVRSMMHPGVDPGRMQLNYELPSPVMSNASSYISKNLNSIDSNVLNMPEAHSLLVNIVLSDSLLNLFKDHNFDSCTMCVCNLNIRGADAGVYLPGSLLPSRTDEAQYKCTCGFSAVRNRHLSFQSGLFYEDEYEITGIHDEGLHKRKASLLVRQLSIDKQESDQKLSHHLSDYPQEVMDLFLMQSLMSYSTASSWHRTALLPQNYTGPMVTSLPSMKMSLEISDACEMCFLALDTSKQIDENLGNFKVDECLKPTSMHWWPYVPAKPPVNSQDVIRVMKTIQPMLQEAIQKKRTPKLWETTYTVSGPLTWRQFHRLAGRGTEDQCEPQPVPSLLVGYDKELVALSPFAFKFWEKLLLEPYSLPRDVAYIVLAPDNNYILERIRMYFKELSRVYEMCRMGKHSPITKVLSDGGIMKVGKTAAKKVSSEPVDDWFNSIGDSSIAGKLKLYAQVCRHRLAPHLASEQLGNSLFEGSNDSKSSDRHQSNPSPKHPTATTPDSFDGKDSASKPPVESANDCNEGNGNKENINSHNKVAPATGSIQQEVDPSERQIPAVVIYMVDPFSYLASGEEYSAVHRLAMVGLLRCYAELINNLPEKMKNNIHLQIVSLENVINFSKEEDRSKNFDRMKGLAFSVFTQARRVLHHECFVKSLTGFGPAASGSQFLNSKDQNAKHYKMYAPAYILAPTKDKQTELGELYGDRRERSSVLFCTYCLSDDQNWLIASCTDDRGEILETCSINIEIPNRTRRKKASARRVGLSKLVDFLLGVMSMRVQPWRLVIGRLGRIGHGELKGWNSLLSKKSLMKATKILKDQCKQCSELGPLDTPVILSACLVSIEPDSALSVMSDQYTPDERFSSSCNSCPLSTPQDASCTHILVFPTSAITQSSQATFQQEHIIDNAEDIFFGDDLNEDLQVDQDINAIFNWADSPVQSPVGSPRGSSQPGSPGGNGVGRQDMFQNHGQNQGASSMLADVQEETAQLAQQPLALGYYVSTAKTGPLPKWFWSSCSHLEYSCPAFLKSALLIHSPSAQQNSEDMLQSNVHGHPLDSNLTTDVLRYVLEGYNSLSWLSIDPTTHDRRSCLPVHVQVLMQMYHTMQALI